MSGVYLFASLSISALVVFTTLSRHRPTRPNEAFTCIERPIHYELFLALKTKIKICELHFIYLLVDLCRSSDILNSIAYVVSLLLPLFSLCHVFPFIHCFMHSFIHYFIHCLEYFFI
uniref:Uncharacterized protein n=1 Tax=Cacopsylla melanoneura TaxID=428564 RepID=A0A8D9F5D3_9HEMI